MVCQSRQDLITQTVYDAQGRVSATLDPVGNQTRYYYDLLGRRIKTIANFVTGIYNPLHPDQDLISTTVYDLAGRVIQTTDPRGTQTAFGYDRAGRRVQVTQAAGTPLASTTYTCFDKGGRVLRVIQNYRPGPTDALPDARDAQGNFLFNPATHGLKNDQNLVTAYSYDRLGRQLSVSDPLGSTTQMVYDKDGQLKMLTDALNVSSQYRFDRLRRRNLVVQSYQSNGQDPAFWVWNTTSSRWEQGA